MTNETTIGAAARKRPTAVEPMDPAKAKTLAAGEDGATKDALGVDGLGPEHEFDLEYTDDRGRVWRGRFGARVMSVRDRISVGLTKSRMSGGLSPAQLDPQTDQLLEVVATLTVALTKTPPWADPSKLMGIRDVGVLGAIYGEVSRYEARFHGSDAETSG